jgi:predicted  nucleic acid-binding Zn-ribbon protein
VVTAAPQDQWRLLDVQAHDTRLAQIAHRRRTLPEHSELEAMAERRRALEDRLVEARTLVEDVTRELTKAEADVDQVRQRAARDQVRLNAGMGTAKDLQALQHEVETLASRQAALEDIQLEVMERLEQATADRDRAQAEITGLDAQIEQVAGRRETALAALAQEQDAEQRERENSAAGLGADLLALYERIREAGGGIGAARLSQRRCEGCRLELSTTDLGVFRAAAEDAVLRCEECGRILVRTADSGL